MFTSDRGAVHDLILGDGVVFVVDTRPSARRLSLDDVDLHVLDLDPHQEEVDLPHDDVFQVVPVQTQMETQADLFFNCLGAMSIFLHNLYCHFQGSLEALLCVLRHFAYQGS